MCDRKNKNKNRNLYSNSNRMRRGGSGNGSADPTPATLNSLVRYIKHADTALLSRTFTLHWLHWLSQREHDPRNRNCSLWTHESYDLLMTRPPGLVLRECVLLVPGVLHGVLHDSLLSTASSMRTTSTTTTVAATTGSAAAFGVRGVRSGVQFRDQQQTEGTADGDDTSSSSSSSSSSFLLDRPWSAVEHTLMDNAFGTETVDRILQINSNAAAHVGIAQDGDDSVLDVLLAARMISGCVRGLLLLQLIRMERSREQQLSRQGVQQDNVSEIQHTLLKEHDTIVQYMTYTVALVDIVRRERQNADHLQEQIMDQQMQFDNNTLNEIAVMPLVSQLAQIRHSVDKYQRLLHVHLAQFMPAYRWLNAKVKRAMDSSGMPLSAIIKQVASMDARERRSRPAAQFKTFQRRARAADPTSHKDQRTHGIADAIADEWKEAMSDVDVDLVRLVLNKRRIPLGRRDDQIVSAREASDNVQHVSKREDPVKYMAETYQALESYPVTPPSLKKAEEEDQAHEETNDTRQHLEHTVSTPPPLYCFQDDELLSKPFNIK